MVPKDRQENTDRRRTEILDAEYIPVEEVPVVPRVHSAPPPGKISPLGVITVLIALLAVAVAATRDADPFPVRQKEPVVLTEARAPAVRPQPAATEAPVLPGEATLGVAAETVRPPVAAYYTMKECPLVPGAQVYALDEDGPGAAAGLQAGDVITAVDGQSVASASDLCQTEAGCRPGDTMELTVFRKGEYLTLEAVLEAPTEGDDFFHTVTGK